MKFVRVAVCVLSSFAVGVPAGVHAQAPASTPNPLSSLPAPEHYSVENLPPASAITPPPAQASSTTPVVSAPSPTPAALPVPSGTPAPTPTPSPTPLPDGTMPLPVPPLPQPALPDASTLSEELNLAIPEPGQDSEPLRPGGEAQRLKSSEEYAMQQRMVMATFEKSLEALIAKQRNPKVPDLSMADAVQIVLRQNPTLLNAIQQIRLTRGQLIQVVSQAVPQIRIASSYNQVASPLNPANQFTSSPSQLIIPNPSGGKPIILETGGGAEKDVQNQTWNISFTGSQLIFDGGQTTSAIRAGSAAYDAAFFSLRATIDGLVSQVTQQFYQVVLNRALIVAQQQNVALLEQQVKDQQNRYEAGTVPRFNVLQAEVQLANAKPPLIQAENNYRISLYQLVQLLGMDYPAGFPSEVPFNVVGSLGYKPQTVNPDDSIRVAIARNPGLKAQRQGILQQAANVSSQIGGFFPSINATAGYQFENNTSSPDLGDSFAGWFFGATGNWNFWDGGLTYGNVAQAKAQLMQAKNNYDNGVRQVVLDVQQSISNLTQARQTIDATTASVVQATEALRLSRERLDAGAGTQLDVLNAQVQLLQAQTNVLQARYDFIAAMATYEQALSLDTQYVELFDDPLVRPLNRQALSKAESRKLDKLTAPDRKQPELPRKFRKEDPIKPILEAAPSPTPQAKKKKNQGINKS